MRLISEISLKKVIVDFLVILIFSGVFITIWMWDGTGTELYREDVDTFNAYLSMVLSQFIGFLWAYDRHPENRLGHLIWIGIVSSVLPFIVSGIIIFDMKALIYAMGTIYVPLFAAYGLRKYVIKCH